MAMITFPSYHNCNHPKCPLRKTAGCPGMPTEPYHVAEPTASTAILITGDHPGAVEDRTGHLWRGPAGDLLKGFIRLTGLTDHADIYFSNVCRCRPGLGTKPTVHQANYCKPYLLEDLSLLDAHYSHLILFLLGSLSTRSLLGLKLSDAFNRQRTVATNLPGRPTIFVSNNPAILLPNPHRKPSAHLIHAVEIHWQLLARYLLNPSDDSSTPVTYVRSLPPPLR